MKNPLSLVEFYKLPDVIKQVRLLGQFRVGTTPHLIAFQIISNLAANNGVDNWPKTYRLDFSLPV